MSEEHAYRIVPDPSNFESALALARQLLRGVPIRHFIGIELSSAEPSQLVRVSEELGGGVTWKPPKGSVTKAEIDKVAAPFFDLVRSSQERGELGFHIDCHFSGGPRIIRPPPPQSFSFMRNEHWPGSVDITCGVVESKAGRRQRRKFFRKALRALDLIDVRKILDRHWPRFSGPEAWAMREFHSPVDDADLKILFWDHFEPANFVITPRTTDRAITMFGILKNELADEFHDYAVTVRGRPDPTSERSILSLVPKPAGSFSYHALVRRDLDDEYLTRLDAIAHSLKFGWVWVPALTPDKDPVSWKHLVPPPYDTSLEKEGGRFVVFVRSKALADAENARALERKYEIRLLFMPEHSGGRESLDDGQT